MKYKEDDINLLVPSFRARVVIVLDEMKALGYQPCLRDTLRTKLEAERNEARGVGIRNSMHLYGVAADVICDVHGWGCRSSGCKFFQDLRETALKAGCFIGPQNDWPHFQAVPASVGAQDKVRKAKNVQEIDDLCKKYLRTSRI